jgi:hypothetical protein
MTTNQNLGGIPDGVADLETALTDIVGRVDAAMSENSVVNVTAGGTIALSDTDLTRANFIQLTGTPAAAFTLTVPATHSLPGTLKKLFVIGNLSGQDATVEVAGGAGASVVVSAATNAMLYTDGTDIHAFASGGTGGSPTPTRSTVTLSGASTNVSIPAGCTWFRMVSEEITLTNGAGNLSAELYHTGNTVQQTFKSLLTAIQLAAAVSVGTGNTSFAFSANTSSATSRGLAGTIHSPRDATKKSMGDGRGYNTAGNVLRYRDVVANTAADDDTVRIVTDVGTLTGTVHFEWFYS